MRNYGYGRGKGKSEGNSYELFLNVPVSYKSDKILRFEFQPTCQLFRFQTILSSIQIIFCDLNTRQKVFHSNATRKMKTFE